ncbi:hypothetical protein [Streptomyces sp. NPDC057748]|uniref:hypothetical protein n=1 Tax=unclassified Streptomyces TaxID=2593676 RepID=UPI0036C2E342
MSAEQEDTREMRSSHAASAVSAAFDDSNLIAHAGLVPVMRLAERCGLSRLVAAKVNPSTRASAVSACRTFNHRR